MMNTLLGLIKKLSGDHGGTCLSVIVPLRNPSREGAQNSLLVEHALRSASEKLEWNLGKKIARDFTRRLNAMVKKADFANTSKGIGFFLSESVAEKYLFHNPVTKKIMISDRFELRDLLFESQQTPDFIVFALSEKELRLFQNNQGPFREVKDGFFPKKYSETYEYSRSFRGSSYGYSLKSTEKDKSALSSVRTEAFFRQAIHDLQKYLTGNTALVITGIPKELSLFKKAAGKSVKPVGEIPGNFLHDLPGLSERALELVGRFREKSASKNLRDFIENSTGKNSVTGLRNVWKAARQGRGHLLLVEKDFRKPAFVGNDPYRLYLRPPGEKHRIVTDAVDEIIETVIGNGGAVTRVENGALGGFENIGLVLKYKNN